MKIVWDKFHWQRFGRFWLQYEQQGEIRYAHIYRYFTVKRNVAYWKAWNDGFRAK